MSASYRPLVANGDTYGMNGRGLVASMVAAQRPKDGLFHFMRNVFCLHCMGNGCAFFTRYRYACRRWVVVRTSLWSTRTRKEPRA